MAVRGTLTSSSRATHCLCTSMLLVRWPRSEHLSASCRKGQLRELSEITQDKLMARQGV